MSGTAPAGFRIEAHDRVGSTNDLARERARAGAPDRTVVRATSQSGGRGRHGRAWDSPPGNLYCSTLLRPAVPGQRAGELTFLAAVALAEALDRFGVATAVKWPNDLLAEGAKIAGILLEAEHDPASGAVAVVIGTGVNVRHHPDGAGYPTTSLVACGVDVDADAVLAAYLAALGGWLDRWTAEGFAPVRARWLDRAAGRGGPVTVRLPREEIVGIFDGLEADGTLRLVLPDGRIRPVTSGEVFFGEAA